MVSGRVVREDGGPVTNVNLTLYDGERYVQSVSVDKNGRFSFKVYGDFKYALEAWMWVKDNRKSGRVAITDKPTNLRIVVK